MTGHNVQGRPASYTLLPSTRSVLAWQYWRLGLTLMLGSAEDVPVIAVGGGAALCADALPGASAVHRPEHADVANAIGAAIPQARLSTYLPL